MSNCAPYYSDSYCGGAQYVEGVGCLIYPYNCLDECSAQCQIAKQKSCSVRRLRYSRALRAVCLGNIPRSYYISLVVVICFAVCGIGLAFGICCGWKNSIYHKRRQQRMLKKNTEDVISVVEVPSELVLDSSKPGTPNLGSVETPVVATKSVLFPKH